VFLLEARSERRLSADSVEKVWKQYFVEHFITESAVTRKKIARNLALLTHQMNPYRSFFKD
jgi:hypothetical protein